MTLRLFISRQTDDVGAIDKTYGELAKVSTSWVQGPEGPLSLGTVAELLAECGGLPDGFVCTADGIGLPEPRVNERHGNRGDPEAIESLDLIAAAHQIVSGCRTQQSDTAIQGTGQAS